MRIIIFFMAIFLISCGNNTTSGAKSKPSYLPLKIIEIDDKPIEETKRFSLNEGKRKLVFLCEGETKHEKITRFFTVGYEGDLLFKTQ